MEVLENYVNDLSIYTNRSDVDDNIRIAELLNALDEDDEEEIDALISDDIFFSDAGDEDSWEIIDEAASLSVETAVELEINSKVIFVNGINCAAHTLQLAGRDALRILPVELSNIFTLASKVCKFFRKESTRNAVKNYGLKMKVPSMDMPTRWSSTYIMVCKYFVALQNMHIYLQVVHCLFQYCII